MQLYKYETVSLPVCTDSSHNLCSRCHAEHYNETQRKITQRVQTSRNVSPGTGHSSWTQPDPTRHISDPTPPVLYMKFLTRSDPHSKRINYRLVCKSGLFHMVCPQQRLLQSRTLSHESIMTNAATCDFVARCGVDEPLTFLYFARISSLCS